MAVPAISSVTPGSGPVGTKVTVTGSGFTAVTGLTVGGVVITPTIVSDTQLTFVIPKGMATGVDDIVLAYDASLVDSGGFTVTQPVTGGSRTATFWPGLANAYSNQSIRTGAVYVDAKLPPRTGNAAGVEKIVICMDPSQPVVPVYKNGGQHDPNRCLGSGGLFSPAISVPFDQRLLIPSSGLNYPAAILGSDGMTRWEAGNFAHCTVGGKVTAGHMVNEGTIEDAGLGGASGGSGLSTLMGTIRYGEFTHGSNGVDGHIRHALRFNLNGHTDLSSAGSGWRWPADHADGGYSDPSSNNFYGGSVPQSVEGSLYAIPQQMALSSLGLKTKAGMEMAWTLQNYGGYCCNDSVSPVWPICMEVSAVGDCVSEFQSVYGFPFQSKAGTPWGDDMALIFSLLHVVDNNTSTSIGGTGTPLQPPPPPFA